MTAHRCGLLLALLVPVLGGCGITKTSVLATGVEQEGVEPIEVLATFSGNSGLSDRRLFLAAEGDLLLMSEGAAPEGAAFDAALSIASAYRSEGYPDVDVQEEVLPIEVRADEPDLLTVHFRVKEGPQITVRELLWHGLEEPFTAEKLVPLWRRDGSGALSLGAPLFVEESLESLATAVATTYRQGGYLKVTVEPLEITRHPDQSATIEITVVPGPRYRFGTIHIDERLLKALAKPPQLPTGPFSESEVQRLALGIRAALRQQGHPNPEVRANPVRPGDDLDLDVRIVGTPGAQADFGEIIITGNTHTDPDYIRSKLDVTAGEKFDGSAVEDGIEKLYRTRLFRRVQIEPLPVKDGKADLAIQLEEADRHVVEFLAGYGAYERFRVGANYTARNLMGQGRELRLRSRLSTRGFGTLAEITDRDMFETDVSGTLRTSLFRREEPSFTDRAAEITPFLGFQPITGVDSRLGYSFTKRLDSRVFADSPASEFENFTEGRVFLDFFHDTRDSVLTPTRGYNASIELDMADSNLGSDVSFLRVRSHAAGHVPLGGGARVSLRWTTGALWPQDGSDRVPLQVRFYNGGESTVRSFRQDRLGPRDDAGVPLGGEFRNVFSAELRAPIFRSLEGSVFCDAGNIGAQVQDYSFDDMSYAVGFGLRLVLPIGPLRVDAAFNPDEDPFEDEVVVVFSLGYPF